MPLVDCSTYLPFSLKPTRALPHYKRADLLLLLPTPLLSPEKGTILLLGNCSFSPPQQCISQWGCRLPDNPCPGQKDKAVTHAQPTGALPGTLRLRLSPVGRKVRPFWVTLGLLAAMPSAGWRKLTKTEAERRDRQTWWHRSFQFGLPWASPPFSRTSAMVANKFPLYAV